MKVNQQFDKEKSWKTHYNMPLAYKVENNSKLDFN